MPNKSYNVYQLSTHLAAEISGINIAEQSIPSDVVLDLRNDLAKYGVLVFSDQILQAAHVEWFGQLFGDLVPHVVTEFGLEKRKTITVLSNKKNEIGKLVGADRSGMQWHSDGSYREKPAKYSILYGVECPPIGADTEFCSTEAAYYNLPPSDQSHLCQLVGIHDYWWYWETYQSVRTPLTHEQKLQTTPVYHPAVLTHPESNRNAIYLSEGVTSGILGMSRDEGRDFVLRMSDYSAQEEFRYVHKWKIGQLVIWDNRNTMHRATEFDNVYPRYMLKAAVGGEKPSLKRDS